MSKNNNADSENNNADSENNNADSVTEVLKSVRFLTDHNLLDTNGETKTIYKAGQYAEIPAEITEDLKNSGIVDDNDDAVAYAKSQQ